MTEIGLTVDERWELDLLLNIQVKHLTPKDWRRIKELMDKVTTDTSQLFKALRNLE